MSNPKRRVREFGLDVTNLLERYIDVPREKLAISLFTVFAALCALEKGSPLTVKELSTMADRVIKKLVSAGRVLQDN